MLSLDHFVHSDEACIKCSQTSANIQEDVCAICQDEACKTDILLLGCCHNFHSDCILTWVQQNFSCPLCRQECQSFVPMNGQSLNPDFTKVWESHFLEKAPKVTAEPKESKKIVLEVVPIPLPNKATEMSSVPIETPQSPQTFLVTSPRIEPMVEAPIPLISRRMADMPLVPVEDWFYSPQIFAYRNRYSPTLALPHISGPSMAPTSLTALLLLESSQAIGNRTIRPNVVRISASEAKIAKHAILQSRVSAVSIPRLSSKRMKLQPFSGSAMPLRSASQKMAPKFTLTSRHHYKTHLLHRTFEKRTISRVASKLQAKLSILL